jgi:nucleoside-diphosphate-sugar epimerase
MTYWQNKPVIVTGADGFPGTHVTLKLAGLGAVVLKPSHADYDLTRLEDMVRLIAAETGFDGKIVWDTSKPNGQPRRRIDTLRAEEKFGFKARTPFLDGLIEV